MMATDDCLPESYHWHRRVPTASSSAALAAAAAAAALTLQRSLQSTVL